MPPFVLEHKVYKPKEYVKNILYTKKVYGPHCKQPNWNFHELSLPFDHDPFSPKYSLHRSHYIRLGTSCDEWTTTTYDAIEEANSRRHELHIINPYKPVVNLHSFLGKKSLYECPPPQRQICSSIYGQDYLSTMQYSYNPPYPYIAQRLSMPETPYLLNRRPKALNPGRFIDDNYATDTQKLVATKASHHVSFNPGRGCYTYGGNEIPEGNIKH